MGKKSKAKKKQQAPQSWCWYCDREFEDDKVLLQHQKAKHFRCPHCPRRLNTAGGLSVHIDQVHKLGVDKIDNALPGRDSFDVEIYGMEGIPSSDLSEWKKRKAAEAGDAGQNKNKKQRIELGVLSEEDLQRQLDAHKALMGGGPVAVIPPPAPAGGFGGLPPPFPPPPMGMGSGPPGFVPPPGISLPPGIAPPPGFPAGLPFPPPGMPFPPPGLSGPPPFPGIPPPSFSGPSPSPFGASPGPGQPGFGAPSPFPQFQASPPPPPQQQHQQQQGNQPPPAPTPLPKIKKNLPLRPQGPKTLKAGQVMIYGDEDTSPEEYRSRQSRYEVVDDGSIQSVVAEKDAGAGAGATTAGVGETPQRGTKRARAEDFA